MPAVPSPGPSPIEPCPPADPQKKGIVESGVKYLKGNFLPTRQFRDLPDLNAQVRAWVTQEAGSLAIDSPPDHHVFPIRPLV